MCFAVAGCAFFGALLASVVSIWLSGWMTVAGMLGISLFYLALGLLEIGSTMPLFQREEEEIEEPVEHRPATLETVPIPVTTGREPPRIIVGLSE